MNRENGKEERDERWDENNKPREFIIGVSPGFSQYMSEKDAKLDFQGFWRKIMKATRFGFEFVMIDYEALSEMYEPDIDRKVAQVKETEGVEIGLHLPFAMDLTEAYTQEWDSKQQMLIRGVYAAARLLKAKFALVHSANSIHPALTFNMGTFERPGKLCSFEGTNLGDFLEMCEKGKFRDPWREYFRGKMDVGDEIAVKLKGWFIAKFLKALFTGIAISPEPIVALYEFEHFDEAIDTYIRLMLHVWESVKEDIEKFIREAEEYGKGMQELQRLEQHRNSIAMALGQDREKLAGLEKDAEKNAKEIEELKKGIEEKEKSLETLEHAIKELKGKMEGIHKDAPAIAEGLAKYAAIIRAAVDDLSRNGENGKKKVDVFERLGKNLVFREMYDEGLYLFLRRYRDSGISTKSASIGGIFRKFEESFREGVAKFGLAYQDNGRWKLYLRLISGLADHVGRYDIDVWFDSWKYHGSEGMESQAYRAVAKFMYSTRDPMWREVVEKDHGEIDPDILIDIENGAVDIARALARRKGKEKMFERIMSMNAIQRRRLLEKVSAAVAGKYIQGHLFARGSKAMGSIGFVVSPKGEPAFSEEERKMSVYEYLKKYRLQFYLENGFNRQEGEVGMGKVRIMHMSDHCRIVHVIDRGAFVNYCPDFEHLIVNFIDPSKDIEEIDGKVDGENAGYAKYITQIHINSPRPINATHGPINPLSTDMQEIYQWLYGLWKKGMKAAYFIWEMGSFGVRESAIAFRKFKEALEKDPPPPPDPEKLGKEFFGIDEKFMAATELAIMEHGLDPLEGLFMVPEEKHGFLGKVVKDKGRIQDWEAEELW